MSISTHRQRGSSILEPPRGLTLARIVALVLIAVVALGLAYLRLAPGDPPLSVPAGAKAGDLILKPGSYATENGSYAADVGTLVVSENPADPGSRLIALPVIRVRARSGHPAEPIFMLNGGPGGTNMRFSRASRYADNHDFVMVGYRGVDGSVQLDCPEVTSALRHSADLVGEASHSAYADGFRACASRLSGQGLDLTRYGIVQQVDDLEAARVALGYDRIDLLGESAGTRTAMIYAWRYPASIHRSALAGVNPPGHLLWDPKATDEEIARYADLCAKDESCRARTDDLAASMRRTSANMPDRWLFLPIKQGNVRYISFLALRESTPAAAPASGPMMIDSWLSAAEGDASGLWFASLAAKLMSPDMFVWGQLASFGRPDSQAALAYFSSLGQERYTNLGAAATSFIWGGGRLVDAWPVAPDEGEYSQVRTSNVETLLIGGDLDFASPPQIAAKELLPYLPNGHQVVLSGIGHTNSFFTEQPEAGARLINTFFDSGQVDDSLYKPQSVDFTPASSHRATAKLAVGALLALSALTVLSLLGMAVWVHRRGGFGRKLSAVLRSLYPLVLGLGGWSLGALVALTAFPTVALDDPLLVVLSMGLPIGLGVYFAWVSHDRSARINAAGFAASMAGALVGAWLGFGAASEFMALGTTLVGGTVGANLAQISLDTAWERSARRTIAVANAYEGGRHANHPRPA